MKKQILITHVKRTGAIGNDCGCPETESPMLPDLKNNANSGELTKEEALKLQAYSEENDVLLDTELNHKITRALRKPEKSDYSGQGPHGSTPDKSDQEEPMLPLT